MRNGILAPAFMALIAPVGAQAQILRGMVLELSSDLPISGAHIRCDGLRSAAVSDTQGRFELKLDSATCADIQVSHVSYLGGTIALTEDQGSGEVPIVFRLEPGVNPLDELVVRPAMPDVVYQRSDLHVGAYRANAEGLWVLVYATARLWHKEAEAGQQLFRDARLYLLDTAFNELAMKVLPTVVHGLISDHAGRVLVEGPKCAWVAVRAPSGIRLEEVDLETLRTSVLPWTDSIPGHLLGNNATGTYPAFDHLARNLETDKDHVICSINDAHLMGLFRSQYKYMSGHDKVIAMDLELETGIDREVIAGYMTGFHHDIYFRAPYAPLFVVDDTICVFDHYRERILRYGKSFGPIEEIPIVHQRDRDWGRCVLQDDADGQLYLIFKRNARTWVRRIDPRTGAMGPITRTSFSYPEELQVFDDYLYYVYRPFGSLQKRTLYREPLR